jgi:UDP-galactopyranose mutase
VIENRNHIGGNCYTEKRDNINIHKYGPHIFHTSDLEIWNWINLYAKFNNFTYAPVAKYKDKIYSLPFNMWTFNELWNVITPEDAKKIIESQSIKVNNPKNLEEQALNLVGTDVYEKLIKGYTKKQWMKDPKELPKEIIQRIPVRFTYDNNYFNDTYQGIPIGGYTQIFEKLLKGIEVKLNTDYFNNREYWDNVSTKIIYTGPIDKFFNYQFGELEYKTTQFEHKKYPIENFQGISVMNFTEEEIPYTRIIEHKHFEKTFSTSTWVTYETPTKYRVNKTEPYYPVNDQENNSKYLKYKELADSQTKFFFGGRLAQYKYFDMHQVIKHALDFVKIHLNKNV